MYYVLFSAVKDVETQKKGCIFVLYSVGEKQARFGFQLVQKIYSIRLSVPHITLGMHHCYDDASLRPFVTGLRFALGKRVRRRYRVHFGDEKNILFQLQTYGIPISDGSPLIKVDGKYPLTWHNEWIQIQLAQEASIDQSDEKQPTILPHRFDVLFGKGNSISGHTGNLRAAHLVSMWQSRYDDSTSRHEKTEIAKTIVQIIHESNGRFLRWDRHGWVEVDNVAAREKISHFFRNQRIKAAKNKMGASSSKRHRAIGSSP